MTKSSKIIIALLVIILIAVLGIGVWLITDKSAENGSVAIIENTAGVANNETVTGNTSVNNNSSNQPQQQNQNTNNSSSNNTSNTQAVDISTDTRKETIIVEGLETTITTSKYISSLGYSMRYSSDSYTVTSYNEGAGQDVYQSKLNPDIWYSVFYNSEEGFNYYRSAVNSYENITINGYDAIYYTSTQEHDKEIQYYIIDADNGAFGIAVHYPNTSEYDEGFGTEIRQMIKTFTINN